jgi:hypothetical protein
MTDALEAIDCLLKHGADPNAEDVDWWPPLLWVSSCEAIHLLRRGGARVVPGHLEGSIRGRVVEPALVKALYESLDGAGS